MSRTRHPFALALLLIVLVAALLGFSGLVGSLQRDRTFSPASTAPRWFSVSP
jgi:hypothetical protein